MNIKNLFYAGMFSSLLPGCAAINPILPTHPFKIQEYSVFVDGLPGYYDIITIGKEKHCYFSKKLENNDELFIHDRDCDLDSDRVLVLLGGKIMAASETKDLEKEIVGMLDYLLLNHQKTIIK